MSGTQSIPPYNEFMWPVLEALKALGGSATVQEMYEWVVADKRSTEEQQAVLRNDVKLTLISDRLHWARSYLKKIDVVENSSRGAWTITEKGRNITTAQIETELRAKRAAELKAKRAEIALEDVEFKGVRLPSSDLRGERDHAVDVAGLVDSP